MDCSPPGSSVHGTSQIRILEWVAIPFSRESSRPKDQIYVSCIGSWVLYRWATKEALIHVGAETEKALTQAHSWSYDTYKYVW